MSSSTTRPRRRKKKGPLQEALENSIADLPKTFTVEMFREKLIAAGITPDHSLIDRLVDHVFHHSEEDFDWPDDHPAPTASIEQVLTITEEDTAKVERRFKKFTNDDLPRVIQRTAAQAGRSFLRQLKQDWPDQHAWQVETVTGFRDRLEGRWGKAFTALRMLLTMSREIGGEAYRKRQKSRANKNVYRADVLIRLHARACQVTGEILALMEAGYADGAMARWRTLHEIAVVVALVVEYGDEIAERYLAHEVVEAKRALDLYQRTYKDLGYAPPSPVEIASVDRGYAEALKRFEPEFGKPYGWAAKHLGILNPNFGQLEEASGRFRMRSHYKMASYNVHAGVKGIAFKLGTFDGPAILAGPSNAGLDEPGQGAAITLAQLTFALFNPGEGLDELVAMWAFARLQREAVDAFVKAGRQLKDEVHFERRTPAPRRHPGTARRRIKG